MSLTFERMFYNSPIINTDMYPLPSEERAFLLSLQYEPHSYTSPVFAQVRTNTDGEKYLEVIVYNERAFREEKYRRFIIHRGYVMEENEEKDFVFWLGDTQLYYDPTDFINLQEEVAKYFCPDIPIRTYNEEEAGAYIIRLYYSTHRGVKELLYKSGLEKTAQSLSDIDEYNVVGRTPEEIVGLPMTLIRILEKNSFVDRIFTSEDRRKAKYLYRRFSSHFDRKRLPNRFQWMYLEQVRDEGCLFDKRAYHRLEECETELCFNNIVMYVELASMLGSYNPYKKMPKGSALFDAVDKMLEIHGYLSTMEEDNRALAVKNRKYIFEDENYLVITPVTVLEFVEEAKSQDNCLREYISEVSLGNTNISFIRKKTAPEESHIVIEIQDGKILQARARHNTLPQKEGMEFIEKLAKKYELEYEPHQLICEDGIPDGRQDLEEYLREFDERSKLHMVQISSEN